MTAYLSEFNLIQHLNHLHLVKYQYLIRQNQHNDDEVFHGFHLLMEHLDGGNLESLLQSKKWLTVNQIVDISFQIISGLRYLHHNQIVHRNIRPVNVMFKDQTHQTAKIIGFSNSRKIGKQMKGK